MPNNIRDTVHPDRLGALTEELKNTLYEALDGLVEATAGDLQNFVTQIVEDLMNVGLIADQATRAKVSNELQAQLKMVGELNRIRLVNANWNTVHRAVLAVTRTLIGTLTAMRPV